MKNFDDSDLWYFYQKYCVQDSVLLSLLLTKEILKEMLRLECKSTFEEISRDLIGENNPCCAYAVDSSSLDTIVSICYNCPMYDNWNGMKQCFGGENLTVTPMSGEKKSCVKFLSINSIIQSFRERNSEISKEEKEELYAIISEFISCVDKKLEGYDYAAKQ